jgi:hypothetical protein
MWADDRAMSEYGSILGKSQSMADAAERRAIRGATVWGQEDGILYTLTFESGGYLMTDENGDTNYPKILTRKITEAKRYVRENY